MQIHNGALVRQKLVYARRKEEINHVPAAYFTDIKIHYGFGERLRVFHAVLKKLLRLLAASLIVVAQISNIVAVGTLSSFLKC